MKTTRTELNQLFAALGAKTAAKWPEKRLRDKIAQLPSVDPMPEVEDDATAKLLAELLETLEDGSADDIEILAEESATTKKATKKPAAKATKAAKAEPVPKKATKAAKAEPVPKKAPKAAAAKKEPKEKKPGVIATIIDLLSKANSKKPITKATILEKLTEAFPDREPESMSKTINVQVPTRLRSDKDLEVQKKDDGYWLAK